MALFHGRRSTSALALVLGVCACSTGQASIADAQVNKGRHHHNRRNNRAGHHHHARRCVRRTHRRHAAKGGRCHHPLTHSGGGATVRRLSGGLRPVATLANTAPPVPVLVLPEATEEGAAGYVKTRLDVKSIFDSFPLTWFKPLTRIMAYPPGGDRYAAAGVPTLAYHDAWTTWGASGATHISEYVAWVQRDREHGYLGQFMDDVNFAGGHIAGTPAQYADLIEAVRAALGPQGVIEINAQMWNLKPMLGNPDVQRALKYVNVVTKEFNVDPRSGISSPSRYGEYLEYVDGLHAQGIGITNTGDSSYNSEADREYSLASYLLVNNGLDFVGFNHQSPTSEYAALRGMSLGAATQGRTLLPDGLWTRVFARGEAIVAPPGTTGSVTLPRAMTRIGSSTPVTSVSLSGGQGAVLVG